MSTILSKLVTYVQKIISKITGESIRVSFIAIPINSLKYEFLYQFGTAGEWRKSSVSFASLMASGMSPLQYFTKYTLPYLVDESFIPPKRMDRVFTHTKVITDKKDIRRIVSTLLENHEAQNG